MTGELAALNRAAERLRGFSRVLDDINVFPVADADTGTNLTLSFAPLRRPELQPAELPSELLLAARGNSGNIGVQFLLGLLADRDSPLATRVEGARGLAWKAVADPKPGTMLSVLDTLADSLSELGLSPDTYPEIARRLGDTVADTPAKLAELEGSGVVDSGALGLFIFLEEFLGTLAKRPERTDVPMRFREKLTLTPGYRPIHAEGHCVDAMLKVKGDLPEVEATLKLLGESAVLLRADRTLKLHLHTEDPERVRAELERHGEVRHFATSTLAPARPRPALGPPRHDPVHVVTDAAGSVTPEEARELGIGLFESYVNLGERSVEETRVDRDQVWSMLRAGTRVTTSQASLGERHRRYHELLATHQRILYLAVGSTYTGNYAAAAAWSEQNGAGERFRVLDTGAASGRLAVVARATATLARTGKSAIELERSVAELVLRADELIFLDRLHYLAQSGRMTRTGAWLGDWVGLKPVVTPTARGAKKVGLVRSQEDQLRFAVRRLTAWLGQAPADVLLQYTDNRAWVSERIAPVLRERWPGTTFRLAPLSLTTAVHTGPGTWAVAVLPESPPYGSKPPCE